MGPLPRSPQKGRNRTKAATRTRFISDLNPKTPAGVRGHIPSTQERSRGAAALPPIHQLPIKPLLHPGVWAGLKPNTPRSPSERRCHHLPSQHPPEHPTALSQRCHSRHHPRAGGRRVWLPSEPGGGQVVAVDEIPQLLQVVQAELAEVGPERQPQRRLHRGLLLQQHGGHHGHGQAELLVRLQGRAAGSAPQNRHQTSPGSSP